MYEKSISRRSISLRYEKSISLNLASLTYTPETTCWNQPGTAAWTTSVFVGICCLARGHHTLRVPLTGPPAKL